MNNFNSRVCALKRTKQGWMSEEKNSKNNSVLTEKQRHNARKR
jgi:hypothetical protein